MYKLLVCSPAVMMECPFGNFSLMVESTSKDKVASDTMEKSGIFCSNKFETLAVDAISLPSHLGSIYQAYSVTALGCTELGI